jgi:hypothetical protein
MAGSEDVYVLSKYIDEWLQDPSAYDSDAKALVEGVRGLERDLAASEDRERQHKAALDAMRIERDYARMRLDRHAAHLADEVAVLVKRRVIDSRSPAADALLDFRNPPSSPRADRLTVLENQSESFRLQLLGEREARCDREADVERLQALVPTWIPCAERLPEHFAWVLVAFCEGVVQRAFLRDDGWVLVELLMVRPSTLKFWS